MSFSLTKLLGINSLIRTLARGPYAFSHARSISLSTQNRGEKFYVAPINASDLTHENLPPRQQRGCPICSRGIKFTHKDVLFLSQFMNKDGMMLNRRITGVCKKQQKIIHKKVNIARRLGILPNYTKLKDRFGS